MCGEGGEFETLVLDCPIFKKRIILKDCEIVTHIDNIINPVFYLKSYSFSLQNKTSIKEDTPSLSELQERFNLNLFQMEIDEIYKNMNFSFSDQEEEKVSEKIYPKTISCSYFNKTSLEEEKKQDFTFSSKIIKVLYF